MEKRQQESLKDKVKILSKALATLFLTSLMWYIAWNAIAKATGLPTFGFEVCFAVNWLIDRFFELCGGLIKIVCNKRRSQDV